MLLYIVEDGQFVAYEREGECNKCGECCRRRIHYQWDVQKISGTDEGGEDLDLAQWEGWTVIRAFQTTWWWLRVGLVGSEHHCEMLGGDGVTCSVWKDVQEFGPLCWFWPIHPDNLVEFPGCSFSFRRVDTEGEEEV